MRKRRHINADPEKPTLRSTVAAATEPLRKAAFVVEERLVWRGTDRLRDVAEEVRWRVEPLRRVVELAKWPLERIAWTVERLVVWPLQERAAGRGPSVPRGSLAPAAAIVAGLVVLGIVLTTGSGSSSRVVLSAAPTTAAPEPAVSLPETTSGAVLHGAPPTLGLGPGNDLASASGAAGDDSLAALGGGDAATQAPAETGATTSSGKPVPAGPAAMRVARRFAEAFVFYEIGRREGRAETVFEETASPALAEALVERPPRLPASGRVPKAKVLNLVPGPRSGRAYTVSVSLLRIGVTSELRLEMKKSAGNWAVTDVRG
jgi:hypothetical protein